jgi:ubiquinone/menaquinone biosynthesis C-methylase UbiE
MTTRWRRLIKRFHPEGIPWPASIFYNTISSSEIFLRHYEIVAQDLSRYGDAKQILDIGTGPGRLLIELRKLFPQASLFAADISPAMIEQAKKNLDASGCRNNIKVDIASVTKLPYDDAAFDLVISTGSMHHWKDPIPALSEIHRVTKPGGHALMYDLVRKMPDRVRDEVRSQFGGFRLALLWLHSFEEPFFSPEEMTALGKESDFTVEGIRFAGALCCLVLIKSDVQT